MLSAAVDVNVDRRVVDGGSVRHAAAAVSNIGLSQPVDQEEFYVVFDCLV